MDTMRAVIYDRPGHFAVREVPMPRPGVGEVLLRVLIAGVCGTDLHLHVGEFGPSYPLTPGHEFVGEIVTLGADVDPDLLGHRVVVDNTTSCGHCVECRRAQPVFCENVRAQGVNAPGGFAEYVLAGVGRCFVSMTSILRWRCSPNPWPVSCTVWTTWPWPPVRTSCSSVPGPRIDPHLAARPLRCRSTDGGCSDGGQAQAGPGPGRRPDRAA